MRLDQRRKYSRVYKSRCLHCERKLKSNVEGATRVHCVFAWEREREGVFHVNHYSAWDLLRTLNRCFTARITKNLPFDLYWMRRYVWWHPQDICRYYAVENSLSLSRSQNYIVSIVEYLIREMQQQQSDCKDLRTTENSSWKRRIRSRFVRWQHVFKQKTHNPNENDNEFMEISSFPTGYTFFGVMASIAVCLCVCVCFWGHSANIFVAANTFQLFFSKRILNEKFAEARPKDKMNGRGRMETITWKFTARFAYELN